jgi:hypothetical protein
MRDDTAGACETARDDGVIIVRQFDDDVDDAGRVSIPGSPNQCAGITDALSRTRVPLPLASHTIPGGQVKVVTRGP